MKKYIILALMVLTGIGLSFQGNAKAQDSSSNRTITYKHGVAKDANTLITSQGGTLHMITGYAEDSNCEYSIHDASAVQGGGTTNQGTKANTLAEGGEATDQDNITNIDFGPEGMPFVYGLVVMTTTCNINVTYR